MLSILLSPIGRRIATWAALVALLGAGVWWLRYDAVSDERAAREAAAAKARLEHIEDAKGLRNDAEKLDDDGLFDALGRWMRPGD